MRENRVIKPFPARHSALQTSRHNYRRRLMRRTPTTRSRSPPRRGSAPPPFCSVHRAAQRGDAARARVDTAFPLAPSSLRVRLGASHLRRRAPASQRAAPSCSPPASTAVVPADGRVPPPDSASTTCVAPVVATTARPAIASSPRAARPRAATSPPRADDEAWGLTVFMPVMCPGLRQSRFGLHT